MLKVRRTLCLVRRHLHWVLPMHCQSLLCCRALPRHAHENPKTQYMTFLDFQETSSSYWYGVVQCSAKLMICLILYILSSGFERMMMQGDLCRISEQKVCLCHGQIHAMSADEFCLCGIRSPCADHAGTRELSAQRMEVCKTREKGEHFSPRFLA